MAKAILGGFFSTPEARFWNWFSRKSGEIGAWYDANYFKLAKLHPEELVWEKAIRARLAAVRRGVTCEIGGKLDGRRKLTLSADGDVALFPAVQRIFDAAPPLQGWRFAAFRAREPLPAGFTWGEIELPASEMFFSLARNEPLSPAQSEAQNLRQPPAPPSAIDVALFIPNLRELDNDAASGACRALLEHILGEYDSAMHLGAVRLRTPPRSPADSGLLPLARLAAEFDKAKARASATRPSETAR
ncbi:MAG: hypothetical protein HRF49_01015 [bacterium]